MPVEGDGGRGGFGLRPLSPDTRYVLAQSGIILACALAGASKLKGAPSFLVWTLCALLALTIAGIYVAEAVLGIRPQGGQAGLPAGEP